MIQEPHTVTLTPKIVFLCIILDLCTVGPPPSILRMSGSNESDDWPEEHSEFVYRSQRKFSGLIDGIMGANYVSQLYDDISRRMVQHV